MMYDNDHNRPVIVLEWYKPKCENPDQSIYHRKAFSHYGKFKSWSISSYGNQHDAAAIVEKDNGQVAVVDAGLVVFSDVDGVDEIDYDEEKLTFDQVPLEER